VLHWIRDARVTNLTLTIDDELLKRARIRALEQDTSVNALVREYLEQLAARRPEREGMGAFLAMTESIHAGSGPGGRSWTRDELYER
jgi:plasmid stability protein